jgi:single-stranded-DNA-specific exonuclease
VLAIECEIAPSDISQKTMEMLQWFEPFGAGNAVPRFLCRNLPVLEYRTVGAGQKHLKIQTRVNGMSFDCIGFRLGQFMPQLNGKKSLDVVCEIEENEWNGAKNLQLKLVDFK